MVEHPSVCFVYPIEYHLCITLRHDLLHKSPNWELDMCTQLGTIHMYLIRNKIAYTAMFWMLSGILPPGTHIEPSNPWIHKTEYGHTCIII